MLVYGFIENSGRFMEEKNTSHTIQPAAAAPQKQLQQPQQKQQQKLQQQQHE
jgi:hypothetical protein